jgi:hypothetical protein
MANVIPIFVALVPNMLHHNNVGITYVKSSNFRMEPIRSIPLYFVAMPHSMVTVTKSQFIALAHTIPSMRSKPQTPRGKNLVNMHTEMPRKVDKIFVGQPLDPRGGKSGPPRPSRYFGLPMVDLGKPPNMPYC